MTLAVYVHIPFCTVKCGYCDFNAYAGMDSLKGAYAHALVAEVDAWRDLFASRTVTSVSFGGGTPGEFPASSVAAVLDAIRRTTTVDAGAEISLEANPGTVTAAYLGDLRQAGVTRFSIGAQSFDAGELRLLDRIHSPEASAQAVALARDAGFESVSLDLIYGLPNQPLASWHATLDRAIALHPDHISCYALTVEEGTPLASRVADGTVPAPDPDLAADMFEYARGQLAARGYRHYELSNWARPGHESRHNLVYWSGGDYLGIGAGAHGFIDGWRYENTAHPRAYIAAVASGQPTCRPPLAGPAIAGAAQPPRTTAMFDWLETHLRLVDGFALEDFAAAFGTGLDAAVGPALAECAAAGLVEDGQCDRVRLTARGQLLHSEICARLLIGIEEFQRTAVPTPFPLTP
jgi:oxygen-independent coproporphyrinogen-3 oxidase